MFILDELDLFAAKARQTLLYNLLDALQAADMQVLQHGCLKRWRSGTWIKSQLGLHLPHAMPWPAACTLVSP